MTPRHSLRKHLSICALAVAAAVVLGSSTGAQAPPRGQKWVASWAASVQGPYPSGAAVAQPELKFAFESPQIGATDQTFRLMVRPDLWGNRVRIRLANTFGTMPITFDDAFVGL